MRPFLRKALYLLTLSALIFVGSSCNKKVGCKVNEKVHVKTTKKGKVKGKAKSGLFDKKMTKRKSSKRKKK